VTVVYLLFKIVKSRSAVVCHADRLLARCRRVDICQGVSYHGIASPVRRGGVRVGMKGNGYILVRVAEYEGNI